MRSSENLRSVWVMRVPIFVCLIALLVCGCSRRSRSILSPDNDEFGADQFVPGHTPETTGLGNGTTGNGNGATGSNNTTISAQIDVCEKALAVANYVHGVATNFNFCDVDADCTVASFQSPCEGEFTCEKPLVNVARRNSFRNSIESDVALKDGICAINARQNTCATPACANVEAACVEGQCLWVEPQI